MAPHTLAAVLIGGLWLAGCAHAPAERTAARPAARTRLERDAAGPALAVVPRAGVEPVMLSLWLDVGSRDADPPQLAALAAEAAVRQLAPAPGGSPAEPAPRGSHAEPALRAEVLPDATRFELVCPSRELAQCAATLARLLSSRSLAPDTLGTVRQWLADGRRRAIAHEPERSAQGLALAALLGPAAASFQPLGDAAHDALLEPARVEAFWAAHYGPSRALLVAVGELSPDDATLALLRAPFATARPAAQVRAERAPLAAHSALEVGVDDRDRLWLALGAASLGRVQAEAEALRAELVERRGLAAHVRGHSFAVRGGALALLELDGSDQAALLEAAGAAWARFAAEEPERTLERPAPDDLDALAAQQARVWLGVQAGQASAGMGGLGVGVTVAGGRADRLAAADPDAELRQRTRDRLQPRFDASLASARPAVTGSRQARPLALALPNGVRLSADLGEGPRAALVVRFAGGAASDPPALHGRGALLATLSSHACRGYGPLRLREALERSGVELAPWVDAEGWGVTAEFPAARWLEAIDLVLHCALRPALGARHVRSARTQLRERLDSVPARALARAAQSLAPLAPGALAPWGDADRLANVAPAELEAHGRASRRGPFTRVALVGELPEAALDALARRLAELPADAPPAWPASAPGEPLPGLTPEALQSTGGNSQLVQLSWHGAQSGTASARAFAALLADGLRGNAGVRVRWHGAGEGAGLSWAALSLGVAPAELATLAARVARVQGAITPAALATAARAVAEAQARGQSAALGSALGRALHLAGAAPTPSAPDAAESRSTLGAAGLQLLAQPPMFQLVGKH
jgi:predicted Zn-dependent peptidase